MLKSPDADYIMRCPESSLHYQLDSETLRCLDVDEEAPLPDNLAVGSVTYDDFKVVD